MSPFTTIASCCEVWPAANVSVPLLAVKSPGEIALWLAVAKSTVTVRPLAALKPIAKVALTVPESPSATVTSLIASDGVASSSAIVPVP